MGDAKVVFVFVVCFAGLPDIRNPDLFVAGVSELLIFLILFLKLFLQRARVPGLAFRR